MVDNNLPVTLVRVSVYEDESDRRFVDVEGEFEPELSTAVQSLEPTVTHLHRGRRVRLADLVEAGLLVPGDSLVWDRLRLGESYRATVTKNGALQLEDGRTFASPSRAAMEAAGVGSYDGWWAWRVVRLNSEVLKDVRTCFVETEG